MKQIAVYSLLLFMFVLAGCPQITKNSMDNGSYEIPSWLTGTWWETDANGKMKDGYVFLKDAQKGHLKCYSLDSNGKTDYTTLRPVIMSSVGGKIYFSAYESGGDVSEEGYYLFEFRKISNTEFVLAGVKEHTIDYDASPAEIIKFLEQNKDKDIVDPAEKITYKKK